MAKLKILALVGGISKDSINRRLFGFFKAQAGDRMELDLFDAASLPFFSQDIENDPPTAVRDLKSRIAACDGVLLVTPEYNRSFPGVLKNALDWGSRPWGQSAWGGKPAGIIGASIGAIGTFGAQNHLRQVLSFLDMPAMSQPEFYFTLPNHLEGDDLTARAKEFLNAYIEAFEAWVSKHQ